MLNRFALSAVAMLLTVTAAQADTGTAPLRSGIKFEYRDPNVRPQDDLFRYANGKWLATAPFPPEYPLAGNVIDLIQQAQVNLRAILDDASTGKPAGDAEVAKLGAYYASFMDEARVESLGIKPLQPLLGEIAAIDSTLALAKFIGRAQQIGVSVPYDFSVYGDKRNSAMNAAYLGQSGLGLPNRDYYLRDDPTFVEYRAKYVAYLETLLKLAGIADARARAERVLALETRLAKDQWTPVQNRDPVKTYNRHDLKSLEQLAPGFDWAAGLAAAGLPASGFIVEQPSYLQAFARATGEIPLDDWRTYLTVRAISGHARLLSNDFVQASFDFNSKTLRGVEQLRPRWQRAVGEVDRGMGEALGRRYVERHFPPEAKRRMDELVRNLLAAFDTSIDQLEWMGPATRAQAHDKLRRITVKIGYPDKWRDYSALEIRADDLVGNAMRATAFEARRELAKVGKPVDRSEWLMTPQTVNAYYMPTNNEIVFPAAYLQPPYFDMTADDAVNYGAVGATIGHEISHGFDDQGRQYDGNGNLRDWWTAEDDARFKERARGLVKQYSAYQALPGINVNGELTLGENIGDLSGLAVAWRAYQRSLGGKPAPVLDGYTGAQRFFLGYAQAWRGKWREGLLREVVLTDPHAPDEFRANGVLSNMNEFYEAFGVEKGDGMYLPPEDRVKIW
jgi:predicted metalloendopeptidase